MKRVVLAFDYRGGFQPYGDDGVEIVYVYPDGVAPQKEIPPQIPDGLLPEGEIDLYAPEADGS